MFDDIRDLYVGNFGDETTIGLVIAENEEQIPVRFHGSVSLYGSIVEGQLIVRDLRRVAILACRLDGVSHDSLGVLSLAGPVAQPLLTEEGAQLMMQLHYAALTEELEPQHRVFDAVYPEVERMEVDISWQQAELVDEPYIILTLSLSSFGLLDGKRGYVRAIQLDPVTVTFRLAGTENPRSEPANSLQQHCGLTVMPCPPGLNTITRRLPIMFVSVSQRPLADIESLCNSQIAEVCQIWGDKAALDLDVLRHGTTLFEASSNQKNLFSDTTVSAITASGGLKDVAGTIAAASAAGFTGCNYTVVYVVDRLRQPGEPLVELGGGISFDCGTGSWYCVIAANNMDPLNAILPAGATPPPAANTRLLAHELSHGLNASIYHPDDAHTHPHISAVRHGSWNSIATPSGGALNSNRNTLYNCLVFTAASGDLPLNPIVVETAIADCFVPDPVDHYIRDYPGDNGTEPSTPPAGENRWRNSNVWNRRGPGSGEGTDAVGPVHQEPHCTGDNRMYVKLDYRTDLRDPVYVDLYLADPGVSPGTTHLVPIKPVTANPTANRLTFHPPPEPGSPLVQSLTWRWSEVPAPGVPRDCCVFAIAHSCDELSPFASPTVITDCDGIPSVEDVTSVTFNDVFPLLGTDNDVAQRNLHVQNCAAGAGAPLMTTTAWTQMANPLTASIAPRLRIDAREASVLENLVLEIDDEPGQTIGTREPVDIQLADSLAPDERMIVRLRATIPAEQAQGTRFPIELRFMADDQLLAGFQHELRITPLREAAVQVLDGLVGALRDVGLAFDVRAAHTLEEMLETIVLATKEPPGCWRLLGDLIWQRPDSRDAWPGQLFPLAERFAQLAERLSPDDTREPEAAPVRQHLVDLAELLRQKNALPRPVLLERIRALSDRVQEKSRRVRRRRLAM